VTLEEVVRLAQTEFLYTIELPNRQWGMRSHGCCRRVLQHVFLVTANSYTAIYAIISSVKKTDMVWKALNSPDPWLDQEH
jgi:hypothetical protein